MMSLKVEPIVRIKSTKKGRARSKKTRQPYTPPKEQVVAQRGRMGDIDYAKMLPAGHLSVSQIMEYLSCPQQYWRNRVAKQWKSGKVYFTLGGEVHKVVLDESCVNFLETGHHHTLSKTLTSFDKHWKKAVKGDSLSQETPDSLRIQQSLGYSLLRGLWSTGAGNVPRLKPVMFQDRPGVEWGFKVNIAGVPVVGYIDLIEKGIITDLKVVSKRKSPWGDFQLALYLYVTGIRKARFLCLEKKLLQTSWSATVHYSRRHLQRWIEMTVLNVAYAIAVGAYPPCDTQKNFFCSADWCEWHGQCMGS